MKTRSQRALAQLVAVLVVVTLFLAVICVWKWDIVKEIYLPDAKTILFNWAIILFFLAGVGQLVRGFLHYVHEERQVDRFLAMKADGADSEDIFHGQTTDSLIAQRYMTVKDLFARRVPINHSAISSIMVAAESLYQSFPRFVNNVLILTGVFGTVSSLIFALVGASDVLQSALPGEGMGVMLLGMNTALTTTATAIVCYFLFTYFYQKLTDVQTHLFGVMEWAVLVHIIPDFAFDTEAVNHQTEALVREVRNVVGSVNDSMNKVADTLAGLDRHQGAQLVKWDALVAAQDEQRISTSKVSTQLEKLAELLAEGFRLR